MSKMSEFFEKKTETEQTLAILQEIITCEKVLTLKDITITSQKGCINVTSLMDMSSSICIFPDASDRLHKKVLQAIREYMEEIKTLQESEAETK